MNMTHFSSSFKRLIIVVALMFLSGCVTLGEKTDDDYMKMAELTSANQKITELDADTTPTSDDIIVSVDSPGGTPANKKVTIANLFLNAPATTIATTAAFKFGANRIDNGADLIDGDMIGADTIDDDSIDFGDVTCVDLTMSDCAAIVSSGNITSGDSFIIGSADVEEAELEILDGATLSTVQLNYLNASTGTTGTTSTNVVFSESPTLTGTAIAAGIDASGTISGNLFTPDAADDADIGTVDLEFSDAYFADGSILYFGADQDVNITHVADTGLTTNLNFTAGTITSTGALAISAGALTNDSVNSADINWGDITNLGEDGIALDFALTADADGGDYDIHSLDGLYGASDTEYIDLGGDLIDATSDTLITATAPDIRLQFDSAAYLKIVTGDAGITTISQESDGADGITIGDNDDNVIISADNWDVDTTGNATFVGTLTTASTATPTLTFNDSDGEGASKFAGKIMMNMTTTTDDAETADIGIYAIYGGDVNDVGYMVAEYDGSAESWTFGDETIGEDLKWDFSTAGKVTVTSPGGGTLVDFSALNLSTTGTVSGGSLTPVTDDADDFDDTGPDIFAGANLYGGTFIANGTGIINLPAVAVGMNFTIITLGAIAVTINPDDANQILADGVLLDNGDALLNNSTAGDIAVCQYYQAGDWVCTTNGWTDAS